MLDSGETIQSITMASDYYQSYALTSNQRLVVYGYNGLFNLGTGNTTNLLVPTINTFNGWILEQSQAVVFNQAISLLPDPIKSGYVFAGWYTDAALTIPFTATLMPANNIILYAKWTIE
ncbi:MAG: InlB B-repeat-containing protein [Bacillus subtilis]|nr:InlB B-repeat-containing protein [Bacillus subtilis]